MVREEALRKFSEVFEAYGFRQSALSQVTAWPKQLAVSFSPLHTGFQVDVINSDIMRAQQRAAGGCLY